MKYCTVCGAQLSDEAKFCSACGAPQNADSYAPNAMNGQYTMPPTAEPDGVFRNQEPNGFFQGQEPGAPMGTPPGYQQPSPMPAYDDAPSTLVALAGFFLPLVGLVLYLAWRDTSPLKAKSAGKGALISVCVTGAIALLCFFAFIALIVSSAVSGIY